MRELDLKLTGNRRGLYVSADGEILKFKKDKFGNARALYKTEKEKIDLEVRRYVDAGGFFWFMLQLLFFLVSIFGIFGAQRRERCIKPDFKVEAELAENTQIALKGNAPRDGARAFEIEANVPVTESSNVFYTDRREKKILKGLLAAKIVLAIGVIAGIILAVVL